MKIYISGPITGQDYRETLALFSEAEKHIAEAGHEPVNPLRNGLPTGASYEEHLLADFKMLLGSDAILLLFGWRQSKGCRMENNIAMNMGKVIFTSFGSLRSVDTKTIQKSNI